MNSLQNSRQGTLAELQQQVVVLSDQLQQADKKIEQERHQTAMMKTKMLNAMRAKVAFFSNISHEIRTPMNMIMGFSQLMQDGDLTTQQRYYLQQITVGGNALLQLVDTLFDLSRLESGNLQLKNAEFLLKDVVDMLSSRVLPAAEKKELSLDITMDPSMPSQWIGDSDRLGQILYILVDNAIKFTEQGTVCLEIGYTPMGLSDGEGSHRQGTLNISVTDTGLGMNRELRARLFQPFILGDDSLTRQQGGSGLGLTICHHLLALMQGEISVNSEVGKGSCFQLQIPLAYYPVDNMSEAEAANPLVGCRILVVDDRMMNRQIANEILSDWGVVVLEAEDGADALRILQQEPCDLVLMDLLMPVMGGLEATRCIREQDSLAGLPIIAMTGNSSESDRLECLAAGMNDVLAKPMNFDALRQQIAHWLHGEVVTPSDDKVSNSCEEPIALPSLLPAIEDEARDQALLRLGGNITLYHQLLEHFPMEHAQTVAHIQDAMDQHDAVIGQRLAHTLKSSAASLGALLLRDSAAEMEHLFRVGTMPTAVQIQAMAQQCGQLLDQLGVKEVVSAVADDPLPEADCMQQIAQLSVMLERGEERAMVMLEELLPQLRAIDFVTAEKVAQLVDGFDFVAAAALLQLEFQTDEKNRLSEEV